MTYEPFDVVAVPFPFTDSAETKRRPALVLSQHTNFGNKIGHSILAMITSRKNAPWPLDCEIMNKKQSGLTASSVVRMKLFTLDNRFIIKKSVSCQMAIKKRSNKASPNSLIIFNFQIQQKTSLVQFAECLFLRLISPRDQVK